MPTAPRALMDCPFLAVCSVLLLNATLQTERLPLWTVTQTDAPRPVLPAVFFINTVLVVALPVQLGTAAQSMAGPALLTWLAIGTDGWAWLVIAGLFVSGSVLAKPAVDHALTYRSSRV